MEIPEGLEKITDITMHMPTSNIRKIKRQLIAYKDQLESEGKSKKEVEDMVYVRFMELRSNSFI